MTNHRERARQILANSGTGSLDEALVHAVLDLAEAVREGHVTRPAEPPVESHSDVEDLVVVTVQQQPTKKAIVFSGTLGTDVVDADGADLFVLRTPSRDGGIGEEDLLLYRNEHNQPLVARVRAISGIARNLITMQDGTSVAMTRALADKIVTDRPPDLPGFNR